MPDFRLVDEKFSEVHQGVAITDEQLKRKIISDGLIRELIKQLDRE